MKPTKEIIELSKKLHDLGYKYKDLYKGDWFHVLNWKQNGKYYYLQINGTDNFIKDFFVDFPHLVPIPSLEDGLMRLREQGYSTCLCYSDEVISFRWKVSRADSWNYCTAKTPHEAILKAMVKVLENATPKKGE